MPNDRDLKRRVRARMEKSGESYTTARSHVLRKQPLPLPDDKSRTIAAPVATLFEAFTDDASRRRWLDHDLHIRGARPHKSVRIDWPDGTNAWSKQAPDFTRSTRKPRNIAAGRLPLCGDHAPGPLCFGDPSAVPRGRPMTARSAWRQRAPVGN